MTVFFNLTQLTQCVVPYSTEQIQRADPVPFWDESSGVVRRTLCVTSVISRAKLAHAAVDGGDYRVMPAPPFSGYFATLAPEHEAFIFKCR
jgi:hypothetical protein